MSKPSSHLKDKINTAYGDLEVLQNELKKLKTSALSMNNLNNKLDRSMDQNNLNQHNHNQNIPTNLNDNQNNSTIVHHSKSSTGQFHNISQSHVDLRSIYKVNYLYFNR